MEVLGLDCLNRQCCNHKQEAMGILGSLYLRQEPRVWRLSFEDLWGLLA